MRVQSLVFISKLGASYKFRILASATIRDRRISNARAFEESTLMQIDTTKKKFEPAEKTDSNLIGLALQGCGFIQRLI